MMVHDNHRSQKSHDSQIISAAPRGGDPATSLPHQVDKAPVRKDISGGFTDYAPVASPPGMQQMSSASPCVEVDSIDALASHGFQRIAVAIGCFDGVHLGHRRLLAELVKMARATAAEPVVLTFHPHPREVLRPHEPVLLLASREQKLAQLVAAGVKAVVTLPFTREFAALDPVEFLSRGLAAPHLTLTGVCVGRRWRFGAGGVGDCATVDTFARTRGFAFRAVPELTMGGQVVSSTAIRRAIASGLLDDARVMLGRAYAVAGQVVRGQAIAGPVLACPTANLAIRQGILPPAGVYAGRASVAGQPRLPAAIAIGAAPTLRHQFGDRLMVEVHLLDFSGDLYGRELEVEFIRYLREERCFSSPELLRAQIARDLAAIRRLLAESEAGN